MRWLITFGLLFIGLQGNSFASGSLHTYDSEFNFEYTILQDQSDSQEDLSQEYAKELYDRLTKIEIPEDLNQCLASLPVGANMESGYSDSEGLCRELMGEIREIEDLEMLSRTYNRLYLLLYNDGNFDNATVAAEKSFSIAEEINYVEMLARGHQNFAILNSVRGRYVLATEHFLKSREHYKELGDNSALARVYGNMGVTFEQAGNLEKAYEFMHKELAMLSELGNDAYMGYTMVNLGAVLNRMGRQDSALYYYESSLELARSLSDKDLTITNLDNIGAYYSALDSLDLAETYLRSAYDLSETSGFSYQKIYITNNLAKNFLAAGKPDSAERYARQQLDLAVDYEFLYDQQLAYSNLSEIYKQKGDYRRALEAHTSYAEIKDSLLNRDRINELEDLRERYEADQRDQQIELLTLQTQTAEFRRNAYLAGGLLATFLLLLLYFSQRQKSKKNRQMLEKEQEVAEMKSNFFSNISHEFRTPLTLISGPIEMLKDDIQDGEIRNQLDIMEKNADRLLSLINQLLELSRLESGKLELNLEPTNMLTLVKGVAMSFQSLAEMKDIDLAVETNLSALNMDADREKMETVLINLVKNGFAYTPEGGSIIVSLDIKQNVAGKSICRIRIKDTGSGISDKDLPYVFDRFYRGGAEREQEETGSGIGLALAKELVELHDGSIEVSSENNRGTKFLVMIPAENLSYEESAPGVVAVSEASTTITKGNGDGNDAEPDIESDSQRASDPILLLIEDNEDVTNYLKEILGDRYRIIEAADGEQGVKAAFDHIPDLIISDVMMPKKDGFEVAEMLKQDQKTSHIPLILLTAKADREDKMQGLKAHADEYLTKPFRPDELRIRIQNLIGLRQKLKEKYKQEYMLRPGEVEVHSMDEAFLLKVKDTVDRHIDDEDFTVEQLGREVGMSRSQLHRKLTALIDQSATEFIRSYRLHRAKEMISREAGSISEISYAVGFGSPSYFSKCFREEFGMTPSQVNGQKA